MGSGGSLAFLLNLSPLLQRGSSGFSFAQKGGRLRSTCGASVARRCRAAGAKAAAGVLGGRDRHGPSEWCRALDRVLALFNVVVQPFQAGEGIQWVGALPLAGLRFHS